MSLVKLVAHTFDYWVNERMLPTGEVYGYWTVIGTGNAVVGWDPQLKADATTQG